jgi:hypothetical protein
MILLINFILFLLVFQVFLLLNYLLAFLNFPHILFLQLKNFKIHFRLKSLQHNFHHLRTKILKLLRLPGLLLLQLLLLIIKMILSNIFLIIGIQGKIVFTNLTNSLLLRELSLVPLSHLLFLADIGPLVAHLAPPTGSLLHLVV